MLGKRRWLVAVIVVGDAYKKIPFNGHGLSDSKSSNFVGYDDILEK
jgi:hypothetical protein